MHSNYSIAKLFLAISVEVAVMRQYYSSIMNTIAPKNNNEGITKHQFSKKKIFQITNDTIIYIFLSNSEDKNRKKNIFILFIEQCRFKRI